MTEQRVVPLRGAEQAVPKHQRLVEMIREMIVEGALPPGTKINEAALAGQFEVSRTPLRETLKILATEGLVDLIPNRGAWVTKMSTDELEPDYQVLAVLEGLAGELAALNMTASELDALRRLQADMEAAYAAADLHTYFIINQRIHAAILEASRNETLIATHQVLSARVLASRYNANLSSDRWAEAVREHQVIVGLLELRRSEQLGSLLRAHILKKLDALKKREHEDKSEDETVSDRETKK